MQFHFFSPAANTRPNTSASHSALMLGTRGLVIFAEGAPKETNREGVNNNALIVFHN
jgi:hypothetical protein